MCIDIPVMLLFVSFDDIFFINVNFNMCGLGALRSIIGLYNDIQIKLHINLYEFK